MPCYLLNSKPLWPSKQQTVPDLMVSYNYNRKYVMQASDLLVSIYEKIFILKRKFTQLEQQLASIKTRGPDELPHITSDVDQKIIQGLRYDVTKRHTPFLANIHMILQMAISLFQ